MKSLSMLLLLLTVNIITFGQEKQKAHLNFGAQIGFYADWYSFQAPVEGILLINNNSRGIDGSPNVGIFSELVFNDMVCK